MIDKIELGKRLKAARKNANITQTDAASKIGFSRENLVSIEQGKHQIKKDKVAALCVIYGVSYISLMRPPTTSSLYQSIQKMTGALVANGLMSEGRAAEILETDRINIRILEEIYHGEELEVVLRELVESEKKLRSIASIIIPEL